MAFGSLGDAAGGFVVRIGSGDSHHPGSAGFTLVEMIVTLAVFATVMTVVFAALISQQRSFADTTDRAEMQNRLRRGIEVLEREVRKGRSGIPLSPPVRLPDGWNGRPSVLSASGLEVSGGESGGPDTLVVVHALSPPVPLLRGMATASSDLAVGPGIRWEPGMLGIISDRFAAEIFRVSRVDGGTLLQHAGGGIFPASLSKPYPEGASVSPVRLAGYTVSDPGGHALPALVQRGIDRDGNLFVRTVTEGIENLQLRLMHIDGREQEAERIGSGPAAFTRVVGVRIRLVSRGRLTGRSRPMAREAVVALRNGGPAL